MGSHLARLRSLRRRRSHPLPNEGSKASSLLDQNLPTSDPAPRRFAVPNNRQALTSAESDLRDFLSRPPSGQVSGLLSQPRGFDPLPGRGSLGFFEPLTSLASWHIQKAGTTCF